MDKDNNKLIIKAILFANITAFTIAIIKLVTGIITGYVVLLSSALDSCLDLIVSLFNFFAAKKSQEPIDKKYNYGKGKIQGIGATIEGAVITLSGIYVIYLAIKKIIYGGYEQDPDTAILVMLISVLFTGILVLYLRKVYKKTNNLTIKADSLHYKMDILTNLGIITSLTIIKFTGYEIIDSIVSIFIGLYIIYSSQEIIFEGIHMLMDKSIDKDEIEKIKEIINNTDKRIDSYHYLKTRKSGDNVFIEFHLVFEKGISLSDAHDIGDKIEEKIKKQINNAIVLIHNEPYSQRKEKKHT